MTVAHTAEELARLVYSLCYRPQHSRETPSTEQQVALGSPSCQVPGSNGQNGGRDAGVGHQEAYCYG